MGSIIRTAANNVGASGVFSSSAFNNASLNSVTSLPTAVNGKMKLISSQTASASSSISFTGIDSTYRTYCFKFINLHPSNDNANFTFQGSTNGGSSYGVTITSTYFQAFHFENDSGANVEYASAKDLAQSTSYQNLLTGQGNDADQNCSGELWLFNPASTTYVKHFIANSNSADASDISINQIPAGYFNTTSAINAINFQMSSGNIDDGIFALYGIA